MGGSIPVLMCKGGHSLNVAKTIMNHSGSKSYETKSLKHWQKKITKYKKE